MELPSQQKLEPLYPKFEEIEAKYIKELVFKTAGDIAKAARISGLGRSTIYRKLWKYNIGAKWFLSK